MTILLYKNGQWLIDVEQPLEGVSLDNLAAILTNPSDGDVIKYDEASGLWTAGKVDALPPVAATDNGKVLAVKNGAWAASEQGKKFIVTLTPTDLDYSGTMDHTVAEINAAYEAGQEIVFKVYQNDDWTEFPLSSVGKEASSIYPSFNSNALYDEMNMLVFIYTGTTDDGTKQTYKTTIYTLTPAS